MSFLVSKTQNLQLFYVSHFLVFTVFFLFIIFFSFDSLKHWRILNIHANIMCKLLSPPVLMDSTRFNLYVITEVLRKPKHTHFKYRFQNIKFFCAVFPDQILAPLLMMGTVWFHLFVNFSFLFLVYRLNSLALQKFTLSLVWLGNLLYFLIFCY